MEYVLRLVLWAIVCVNIFLKGCKRKYVQNNVIMYILCYFLRTLCRNNKKDCYSCENESECLQLSVSLWNG